MKGIDLKLTRPLVEAGVFRSAEAFSGLYERTNRVVFRYIYALHGEPQEDVEDIWHETFLKAWRTRSRFAGDDDAALGWLLKIARNTVIDRQRRRQRRPVKPLHDPESIVASADGTPEDYVIVKQRLDGVWKQLAALSDDQREMIILRYVVGWRVNQIADHLAMPENTVSVTLRRLLEKLSKQED